MDSFPLTRQASRDLMTSAEDTGRALKSSLTAGSSRLFGSVMGAKRDIIGGISSTFDQVVSIVGGAEEQEQKQEREQGSSSILKLSGADSSSCEDSASVGDGNGSRGSSSNTTENKARPPKPPTPMCRQRSDLDANGAVKQPAGPTGAKISRQNTAPTAGYADVRARGANKAEAMRLRTTENSSCSYKTTSVSKDVGDCSSAAVSSNRIPSALCAEGRDVIVAPNEKICEPALAWHNDQSASRCHEARDVRDVTEQAAAAAEHGTASQHGRGHSQNKAELMRKKDAANDSDADSDATEGCDEDPHEQDFDGEFGGNGGVESGSKNSDHCWSNEREAQLDQLSQECVDFMKCFVQKIFDNTSKINCSDKAKFGELCQNTTGRSWFARCINSQRMLNSRVSENVLYSLVQFFAIVLFECNESEDYLPATSLMNICFAFYHQVESGDGRRGKQFLSSLLKDQPIWLSQRFWTAALFYTVQQGRAGVTEGNPLTASAQHQNNQTKSDDCSFEENISFVQLGTLTSNMRALGLSKQQCLEFLRKQSTIANLSAGNYSLLLLGLFTLPAWQLLGSLGLHYSLL